jgi:hypothetical protein
MALILLHFRSIYTDIILKLRPPEEVVEVLTTVTGESIA